MASQKFNFDLVARNRTAEAFRSVESSLTKLSKGTPLARVTDSFRQIAERGQAFTKIGQGLINMGSSARLSSSGLTESAEAMAGLGESAGVVATALGAIPIALATAGAAAAKFEIGRSRASFDLQNTATRIGISTGQLQKYQIASQLAGDSSDGMAQALDGLGQSLENVKIGKANDLLAVLNHIGVQIHTLPNGAIDTARAMDDISTALAKYNVEARERTIGEFGAAGAMNYMLKTERERQALMAEVVRLGAARSDQQVADDIKVQASWMRLGNTWDRLLNTMSQKAVVPWLQPTLDLMDKLATGTGNVEKAFRSLVKLQYNLEFNPAGLVAKALGAKGPDAGAPAEAGSPTFNPASKGTTDKALAYFMKQGWTKEQAAGIVANLNAESGLDARAVGDRGRAYGIGQWHADRQAEFSRKFGHSLGMAGFDEQLAFVQYELTQGGEKAAGDRLRAAAGAGEAGATVSQFYERPADRYGQAAVRADAAEHMVTVNVNLRGAPPGSTAVALSDSPNTKIIGTIVNTNFPERPW